MFGLPIMPTLFLIIIPLCMVIFAIIYYVRGKFEGEEVEKEYETKDWFWTF